MSSTVQTDRLNTLDALVQLASFRGLPGPSEVRMGRDLLSITLASHDDAIAWCAEFDCRWEMAASNEIWNALPAEWRGWRVQIHSHTEKS